MLETTETRSPTVTSAVNTASAWLTCRLFVSPSSATSTLPLLSFCVTKGVTHFLLIAKLHVRHPLRCAAYMGEFAVMSTFMLGTHMLMRDWWKGKEPCSLIPIETHDRPRAGWSVVPSIQCRLQPASIIVDISGSHMIRVGGGITIDCHLHLFGANTNPESLLWLLWSDFYSSSFSPVSLQQFRHAHCKNFSASRGNCDRFHSWHFDLSQQRKHRRINDGSIPLSGDPATCDELKCLHGKKVWCKMFSTANHWLLLAKRKSIK